MGLDVTTSPGIATSNEVDRINVDAFTMGLWVYVTGACSGTAFTTAIRVSSGATVCRITLGGTTDVVVGFLSAYDPISGLWTIDTHLNFNQPYHVAVSYDKSLATNDPTFYIDGVVAASSEARAPVGTPPPRDPEIVNTVAFGRGQGGLTQLENTLLAEAFFIDTDALNAQEHLALSQFPPAALPRNLQAYWPMRGVSLVTEREYCQGAMLTLENATATDWHPPLAPHSNRLGNRSVVYQRSTIVAGMDKWWREASRPQDPVYRVTSY